jgi:hypothetical protein
VNFDEKGAVTGIADPSAFYVGVAFQFGDLLTKHNNPIYNLSIKALVKGSARPMDSYGVAVGLRGSYLSKFGIDFDLISPFASYLSTREVPEDSAQVPRSSTRQKTWTFGLSLNLDAALAWLKQ